MNLFRFTGFYNVFDNGLNVLANLFMYKPFSETEDIRESRDYYNHRSNHSVIRDIVIYNCNKFIHAYILPLIAPESTRSAIII